MVGALPNKSFKNHNGRHGPVIAKTLIRRGGGMEDAPDLGSGAKSVGVQVPSPAPSEVLNHWTFAIGRHMADSKEAPSKREDAET